jgi:hypothetical protein
MEFIAEVLLGIAQHLTEQDQNSLDWPMQQYREVISSQFMGELLSRAKSASRLPKEIGGPAARALYRTFSIVDRIHRMRGIPDTFRATAEHLARNETLARFETQRLRVVHGLLEAYLSNCAK